MTRLLVLGSAPLPSEPELRLYAANLRTWHLVQPLVADGHEVRLVAGRLPNTYADGAPSELRRDDEGCEYVSVEAARFHDVGYLQRHCDEWRPDAVVGVNTYPSSRAVALATEVPIWCDLNGWVMAEAQTKCRVYDDDVYLSHFWNMERAVVDRADVISTVSEAQAHATVGELAARGRLANATFGYDFVTTIPNAVRDIPRGAPGVVRGTAVPEDAFVVLWTGGYNTWTDVGLLFRALEAAMARQPRLRFVSTGGAIDGHDERTFASFREAVDGSVHRDRYHFAGWVETADVPRYYADADLGINIDDDNYETRYGARNRLNEWMAAGLPVLTTRGTEISRAIEDEGIGLVAAMGDADGLVERLTWAAENPRELAAMAERARRHVTETYSYARTTEPLRAWARRPRRAPDGGQRADFTAVDFFGDGVRAVREPTADVAPAAELARLEAELHAIHTSAMWRWYCRYHQARRALRGFVGLG